MLNTLYVFVGGGVGSVLRYAISQALPRTITPGAYPWATFAANLIGSFVIGLLLGYFSRNAQPDATRLLLVTGLCGGFTTFSSFSNEAITLLRQGFASTALTYVAASFLAAFLLTFVGYKIMA